MNLCDQSESGLRWTASILLRVFTCLLSILISSSIVGAEAPQNDTQQVDVVIWDATPAGITSAIAAARAGCSVCIPVDHSGT